MEWDGVTLQHRLSLAGRKHRMILECINCISGLHTQWWTGLFLLTWFREGIIIITLLIQLGISRIPESWWSQTGTNVTIIIPSVWLMTPSNIPRAIYTGLDRISCRLSCNCTYQKPHGVTGKPNYIFYCRKEENSGFDNEVLIPVSLKGTWTYHIPVKQQCIRWVNLVGKLSNHNNTWTECILIQIHCYCPVSDQRNAGWCSII